MRVFYIVFLLLFCFAFPVQASEALPQNYDAVWSASIASVASKGLPIVTSDKTSGLISTQAVKLQGAYNIPARIKRVAKFTFHVVPFSDVRYAVNILVAASAEGTTITVTPMIEGLNRDDNQWVQFESNGTIEKEIIQSIKDKLPK